MPETIKRLERWADAVADAMAILSVISLVILTALVTFSVIMRYVFNNALTWSDEFASYSLLSIVFFGLAHTLSHGGHIRIDVLTNLLSERWQAIFHMIAYIIGLAFTVFFVMACYHRIANFWVRNTHGMTELYTPLYIPAIPLMIGSVMLFLVMLAKTASHLNTMMGLDASHRRSGLTQRRG